MAGKALSHSRGDMVSNPSFADGRHSRLTSHHSPLPLLRCRIFRPQSVRGIFVRPYEVQYLVIRLLTLTFVNIAGDAAGSRAWTNL
jgi:hypothetical protein